LKQTDLTGPGFYWLKWWR